MLKAILLAIFLFSALFECY